MFNFTINLTPSSKKVAHTRIWDFYSGKDTHSDSKYVLLVCILYSFPLTIIMFQARVCRSRPSSNGESDALAVSEALPFLEYELARQLMLKLKVLGRNAAFSLKSEVDVGKTLTVATVTATAVYCLAMPAPRQLEIARTIAVQDEEVRSC
jgi:hypothetical protein